MSFDSAAKSLFFVTLLAASCVLDAGTTPTAQAAGTPGEQCGAAVAKGMSKCTKKVIGTLANCYKSTGAACASGDAKVAAASLSVAKGVIAKCDDASAVAAAGYGPYTQDRLGTHFGDLCVWESRLVADRAFGTHGAIFTGADDDGKKCLLAAAKETGKYISGALNTHAKCVGKDCVLADTNTAIAALATSAVGKIDAKCDDLLALVGLSSTNFVAATTSQIPSAVASPCDPMDTTRCAFPFPNDYYTLPGASTETGRQMAIGRNAMPRRAGGTGVAVNTTNFNTTDGFSIGPMMLFNNVNIDLAMTGAPPITDLAQSLDPASPVVMIDALTGEQQLIWIERDLRGLTIADQALIIRMAKNLKEGRRYIVALRNMKDGSGTAVPASAGFALYRDNTPTEILPVEMRRPHMEAIFATLTSFGITRSELYLAWDFTTQSSESTASRMLAMRDDAFDILGAGAPAFTVNTTTEPGDTGIFRRIDGTFQVPLYLDNDGETPSPLRYGPDGLPVNEGDFFTAGFRCIIPNSATTGGVAPPIPARASTYGHGLLGSRNEVNSGNVRAMANEHNIVFCATDWTGFATDDAIYVTTVLDDFSNFPTFIDRQHQGILNQLYLGRLMIHASGFASHSSFQLGGSPVIDPSGLFYDGNSQGGILGGVLAAFSQDATRFSLGVPGINYSTLLHRSVDFSEYEEGYLIPDYPLATDRNLLLSLGQMIWDRIDPNGHINHLTADPYEDTPAKTVLYQVAFGDHQVAPVTAEIAARSNGAHIHAPTVTGKVLPEVTPYYDIPVIPAYPYAGSALVIWDSGNPAPPIGNVPPDEITDMDAGWVDLEACAQNGDSDPHSCPRSDPDARIQKSEFLKNTGEVVDVCGGLACRAQ